MARCAPSGESDRRTANRHAFSAVAEVMDRQSGARMAVRIADISPSGCYADALNIFPAGTKVVILIRHADLEFKATATVIYALPSMGMGIRFKEISPDMRLILDKWIAEAQGEFSLATSTPLPSTAILARRKAPNKECSPACSNCSCARAS